MKITIEPVNNGAVMTLDFDDGEEKNAYVYEDGELSELRDMTYDLLSALGFSGGKYDKERISVKVVHGNSYECNDKDCPICREE